MTSFQDPHAERAKAIADQIERKARLAPEAAAYWTKLINRAATLVRPGKRPCDYVPWIVALRKARVAPPFVDCRTADSDYYHERYPELMGFAELAGQPRWPEKRRHLIDFAIAFLEADVMLFRSGYAKRHLTRRLQQSTLAEADVKRLDKVLRRAVAEGAGLEEFRAYRHLAGTLILADRLPELREWLEAKSQGAVVTCDHFDAADFRQFVSDSVLSEKDKLRLVGGFSFGSRKLGLIWPEMNTIAANDEKARTDDGRARRNAYHFLREIQRRESSGPAGRRGCGQILPGIW